MAENLNHQVAVAFLLIDLLLYQIHQLFLLGIQQDGVHHPVVDDQRVKGAADKVGDAQLVGPLDLGGAGFGGNHDNGYVLNPLPLVHDHQHLEAVHFRHDNIQQNQRELVRALLENGDCL